MPGIQKDSEPVTRYVELEVQGESSFQEEKELVPESEHRAEPGVENAATPRPRNSEPELEMSREEPLTHTSNLPDSDLRRSS